jgi:IclR family acetate operon transcriptional repressor
VEQLLQKTGLPQFTPKTLISAAALFADLEGVRMRGWLFDDEERNVGMRCVAAPIYNEFSEAVAGVSVSGPSARFSASEVGELGPLVKRAAARITERIGGTTPGDAELKSRS